MTNLVKRFSNDESGATAIEYSLLAAIMGIGIIVAARALEDATSGVFLSTAGKLAGNAVE